MERQQIHVVRWNFSRAGARALVLLIGFATLLGWRRHGTEV